MTRRCAWAEAHPLLRDYHDAQWGVPLYEDRFLFEFLVLEGMQAGLSWLTVLKKREAFRRAFDGFDPQKVSRYGAAKVRRLLVDSSLIRNRLKIDAAITNAQAFLRVQQAHGSFAHFMWAFVDGAPIRNRWRRLADIPCRTPASDAMSRTLVTHGFRFVGSTICYAHMQATGMVNDHLVSCFRHYAIARLGQSDGPSKTARKQFRGRI